MQLVFTKFAEFKSARQVHIWLRDEGIELPAKSRRGEAHGVVWRLPAYNIVYNILTNPPAMPALAPMQKIAPDQACRTDDPTALKGSNRPNCPSWFRSSMPVATRSIPRDIERG